MPRRRASTIGSFAGQDRCLQPGLRPLQPRVDLRNSLHTRLTLALRRGGRGGIERVDLQQDAQLESVRPQHGPVRSKRRSQQAPQVRASGCPAAQHPPHRAPHLACTAWTPRLPPAAPAPPPGPAGGTPVVVGQPVPLALSLLTMSVGPYLPPLSCPATPEPHPRHQRAPVACSTCAAAPTPSASPAACAATTTGLHSSPTTLQADGCAIPSQVRALPAAGTWPPPGPPPTAAGSWSATRCSPRPPAGRRPCGPALGWVEQPVR